MKVNNFRKYLFGLILLVSLAVTLAWIVYGHRPPRTNYTAELFQGESSTLVMMKDGKVRALNAPIHKRIPMWNRPVANHLGVYAE